MKCLPKKISSNYGFYTAQQWKNWTPIYLLYTLEGIFGDNHLQCWLLPSSYELNGFNILESLWRDSKSHQIRRTQRELSNISYKTLFILLAFISFTGHHRLHCCPSLCWKPHASISLHSSNDSKIPSED